jgi:RecA-family ATPase
MDHAPEDILRFEGDDVRELDKDAAQDPDWLVDGLFAADETTIIAGSSKSLKTTILCDLVISLAVGRPWLQRFRTPTPKKVLFITGENSRKSAARKLLRSVHSHGFKRLAELPEGSRLVTEAFPNLVDPVHRREIRDVVDEYEIEVVIVDPLYRGLMGTEQGNVADRGEAILGFADAIGEASLILSHHFTKGASRDGNQPRLPMLEDMTGAGVAESCGNWMMINRNKQWEKGQRHDLSLMCGSR